MKYHKNLSAERVRAMPWKTQVGMVASELSRVANLVQSGGGAEVIGCLQRARELLGVLESLDSVPVDAGIAIAQVAKQLCQARLPDAPSQAAELHRRLMLLYSA
jgi:hypothetical protein